MPWPRPLPRNPWLSVTRYPPRWFPLIAHLGKVTGSVRNQLPPPWAVPPHSRCFCATPAKTALQCARAGPSGLPLGLSALAWVARNSSRCSLSSPPSSEAGVYDACASNGSRLNVPTRLETSVITYAVFCPFYPRPPSQILKDELTTGD